MNSPGWNDARRSGLGGSEVAALYPDPDSRTGTIHPWLSQYKLWAIKTGRVTSDEAHPVTSPQLWWGHKLEDDVRDAYEIVTSRKIEPGVTMARHPRLSVMIANTDGTVVCPERGRGVYEGKSTKRTRAEEWAQGVPLYYQIQTQHYLGVTGLDWGSVAVYIAGDWQPLRFADVDRSDRFIDDLMERIDRWWHRYVVADTPPPVDGSRETASALARVYPTAAPGTVVDFDDDQVFVACNDLVECEAQIKALEKRRDAAQNILRAAIGNAEFGRLPDGTGWSLKTTTRREQTRTIKAATFRTLRQVKNVDQALEKRGKASK